MSLHYGFSKHTYKKTVEVRVLNYQIAFRNLDSVVDSYPRKTDTGFPFERLYCKGHHPEAGFRILTHRFDEDNLLWAPLTLRLKIRLALSDGTVELVDLEDVDYYGSDIERCENSFFVERSYKFKDIKKHGTRDIFAFDIVFFMLVGDPTFGNESVMDIVVDY